MERRGIDVYHTLLQLGSPGPSFHSPTGRRHRFTMMSLPSTRTAPAGRVVELPTPWGEPRRRTWSSCC